MKTGFGKLLGLGVIIGLSGANALAANPGPFVSANIGANFLQDIHVLAGTPLTPVTESFNPGMRADATFGYNFVANENLSLGAGAEVGFLWNSMDRGTTATGSVPIDADYFQAPFLGKIILTLMPDSNWNPYVSVGGGGVYSRLDVNSVGTLVINSSGDETDPAFQAEGGIIYKLGDKAGVGASYKMLMVFPDGLNHLINHSVSLMFTMGF